MVYITQSDWVQFQAWFRKNGITDGKINKHEALFIAAITTNPSYYAAKEALEDLDDGVDSDEWRNYLEWLERLIEEYNQAKL